MSVTGKKCDINIYDLFFFVIFLVFNIMVNVANGQSWKEAFLTVIPERKGAKAKEESDEDADAGQELDGNHFN